MRFSGNPGHDFQIGLFQLRNIVSFGGAGVKAAGNPVPLGRRFGCHCRHLGSQGRDVIRPDRKRVRPHQFANTPYMRNNNRHTGNHGFQQGEAERFAPGRKKKEIKCFEVSLGMRHESRKYDTVLKTMRRRERTQFGFFRPLADKNQAAGGYVGGDMGIGRNQHLLVFSVRQGTDIAKDKTVRRQPQTLAGVLPVQPGR